MNKLVEPLPNNSRLAEYKVIKHLGQGGFGTTYLCTDSNLDRKCVIKEYSPHYLVERKSNGELREKACRYSGAYVKGKKSFLNEARSLAKFNHHNIVRINRYFEENNTAYFVMDYESGSSLRDILSRKKDLFEEQEIEAIVGPLCEGLKQLHKMNLIHRDIKPDNILIRNNGDPILIDFGAVIDLNDANIDVIATPSYAPIEQYDSRFPQGPWIDIYALAATIYEMIAGSPPPQAIQRVEKDYLIPAREVGRGKYGDRLLSLIDKGLAVDPAERPHDIGEFLALLRIDNDNYLKSIIRGLSEKTIQHFLNWASPNDGLYADEFVSFCICFPIIDISWRLGKGSPTKELFLSIYRLLDHDILDRCYSNVLKSGFTNYKRNITLNTIESRIDEYSATYLLDRQAKEWTYKLTRQQCARNCLSNNTSEDFEGFMNLMEDVIDRARGRVKKEFEKTFRKVEWIHTPTGWKKEIRSFG